MKKLLLAFYGDDFTGSTDALECIWLAGATAILFVDPPTPEQIAAYPGLESFGVAGFTRSLAPGEMEAILVPAFKRMKATGARHVHYKVCSTFDSLPRMGSIGKAIDCGARVFQNRTIPVLGGTPGLGRYCLFGNLFARLGTSAKGLIHRLDRHPSMSTHPVTPSKEADLRVHLGQQTSKPIGLIDILQLEKPIADINGHNTEEVVLIDTLTEDNLLKIGEWIDKESDGVNPLFSVGSSGVETALGAYWGKAGILKPASQMAEVGTATHILVVSGSRSPVTTAQVLYAKSKGFEEVIINAENIDSHDAIDPDIFDEVHHLLQQQKSVLIHTGEKEFQNLSARKLGKVLGQVVLSAAEKSLVKRVVIAGGDTSSFTARAMEIEAVEMVGPIVTGAPLCRAISKNKNIHGLEVNFKGGQVGAENYFEVLLNGRT